jgi:hypothetical protein
MYRRAYGGAVGETGVVNDTDGLETILDDTDSFSSSSSLSGSLPWPLPEEPIAMMVGSDVNKPLPPIPLKSYGPNGLFPSRDSAKVFNDISDDEKRFCIDFDTDVDADSDIDDDEFGEDIEEYYRGRARELLAQQKQEELELAELQRITPKLSPPPPPRLPALKIQTTFDKKQPTLVKSEMNDAPSSGDIQIGLSIDMQNTAADLMGLAPKTGRRAGSGEEDDEEALTARPPREQRSSLASRPLWNNSTTIDEILADDDSRISRLGPLTPNGYDDISPITRGEWGFLMVGDAWKSRMVNVETC